MFGALHQRQDEWSGIERWPRAPLRSIRSLRQNTAKDRYYPGAVDMYYHKPF